MTELKEIAPGVAHLEVSIANVYFAGAPGGPWALIDTSVPGSAARIRLAAEARYGRNTKPVAILLTHGHYDHSGSARELADLWGVPVYAHRLELPYLTGQCMYPEPDRTAGGFLCFLSRLFPARTLDLGERVRPLEAGREAPGLPGWEWHHTPGHAPGHVAFFRRSDGTLIAGDAVTTVNLDNLIDIIAKKPRICRPPTPFTCDWRAAQRSVQLLAALRPYAIGAGHGDPMSGSGVASALADFATNFPMPSRGRYVNDAAQTNEKGVVSLPPPPSDPVPAIAAAVGTAAIVGTIFAIAAHRRRHNQRGNSPAVLR